MFETPEERVKLLKAGFDGKTIEKLYVKYNALKIVHIPEHRDLDFNESEIPKVKTNCISSEAESIPGLFA